MYKSKPGRRMCLGGCGKMFDSRDVSTNRICSKCAGKSDRDYMPRRASGAVFHNGKRVNLIGDEE